MSRSYSELIELDTFLDRFHYLRLAAQVGDPTFGHDRYLNQLLYRSQRWKRTRDGVIIRDEGCDLAMKGYEIKHRIVIHHINPITLADIENDAPCIYDLENLITTTHNTHNAIHFGDESLLPVLPKDRMPNDTRLW